MAQLIHLDWFVGWLVEWEKLTSILFVLRTKMNPFVVMKDKKESRCFSPYPGLTSCTTSVGADPGRMNTVHQMHTVLNRFSTHILHNAFQELTKSNYRQCKWMQQKKCTHHFRFASQQNCTHHKIFFSSFFGFDECHLLLFCACFYADGFSFRL